jgi:hypothetical protein
VKNTVGKVTGAALAMAFILGGCATPPRETAAVETALDLAVFAGNAARGFLYP